MGIFDKAKDALGDHSDKVDQVVEKGGDIVDDKTGGKYAGQVDQGQELAEDKIGDYLGREEQPPA